MSDEIIQAPGDLFPTVPGVPSSKGVAMNPPPASILANVNHLVSAAMSGVPEDGRGQLVGIATRNPETGAVDVNLALATRIGSRVEVVAWMGKTWGQPVAAGVIGKVTF